MKLNWLIQSGYVCTISDIYDACAAFYIKYQVLPDVIKFSYNDLNNILKMMVIKPIALDSTKEYKLCLPIPGGLVTLCLLDTNCESIMVNNLAQNFFVVENTQIDREFEKHILGEKE